MSELIVTAHAVEQYRRRHAPDLDYEAAHVALVEHGRVATFRSRAAFKGDVFDLADLGCEAVIVDEKATRTMVTVLPKRVERQSTAERKAYEVALIAASEAADAARLATAKAKDAARTLNEKAHAKKPTATKAEAAAATLALGQSKARMMCLITEVKILRMEMRLANEQDQTNATIARRALAIAVRAIVEGRDPVAALAEIQRIEPYFTAPMFYDRSGT